MSPKKIVLKKQNRVLKFEPQDTVMVTVQENELTLPKGMEIEG